MKKYLIFILLFSTLVWGVQAKISGYTTQKYKWFSIHISDDAMKNHPKETRVALTLLGQKILGIERMRLSLTIKERLRSIPIFLEWNLWSAGAMYHPSKNWLIEHGYIEEKEKSVEITNMTNFISWTNLNQPHILTHELAHGYMDKFLSEGEKAEVQRAYENAREKWLYKSVEYTPGGNMVKVRKEAYALTNELEYFAELSEAYLGRNDFYPYVRKDLEKYDPKGYELMKNTWK